MSPSSCFWEWWLDLSSSLFSKWCWVLYINDAIVSSLNTMRPEQNYRRFADHDDVIKWKHFPRNWSVVRGIHRSPVNSPHKGQWRGALMFSLICVWINDWVNNREVGDLRRYAAHYDVIVMDASKCILLVEKLGKISDANFTNVYSEGPNVK